MPSYCNIATCVNMQSYMYPKFHILPNSIIIIYQISSYYSIISLLSVTYLNTDSVCLFSFIGKIFLIQSATERIIESLGIYSFNSSCIRHSVTGLRGIRIPPSNSQTSISSFLSLFESKLPTLRIRRHFIMFIHIFGCVHNIDPDFLQIILEKMTFSKGNWFLRIE